MKGLTINWPSFWKGRYEKAFEDLERECLDNKEHCERIVELLAELEALKALKIPETVRPQTKEIARENGHIYYIFDDLANIPYIRAQQVGHLLNFMNSGIDPDYMARFIKSLHDAIWEDKDPEKIDTLRREIEERFNFGFNTEMLYHIAANLIIRDDEPHDAIPQMIFDEKIAHWMQSNTGDFFLTIAYSVLMKQSPKSGKSTHDGLSAKLKALMKKEKSINERLSKAKK